MIRMRVTLALFYLSLICALGLSCGKSGSSGEFDSAVISGGSRAVARPLPQESRLSGAPSILTVLVGDTVVGGGGDLELEVEFEDPNGDVAEIYAKVAGEDGYVVFPVDGATGLTRGIIDADIGTRRSSPSDQYRLTIVLVDGSGNVSNHIDVLITVSPSTSTDFSLDGCYWGDTAPDLTGTWRFTYLVTEVPADAPPEIKDFLLGLELNEEIAISGRNRERISFRFPDPEHLLSGSTFYGPLSGSGDDVSFGFLVDADFSIPEIGADCSITVSQQVCGTLDCNSLVGESVLIYLDLTGNRACRDAKDVLGAAFRFKARTTATRISGGPANCPSQICTPGETPSCDTGQSGICSEGTKTCNAQGTAFGSCFRDQPPRTEQCGNGVDDDCDGSTDGSDSDCASSVVLLVEDGFLPHLSPDGTKVAFARLSERSVNAYSDIWVVNIDGSGLRRLTNTPSQSETSPQWTPDGSRIAFVRYSNRYFTREAGSIHDIRSNGQDEQMRSRAGTAFREFTFYVFGGEWRVIARLDPTREGLYMSQFEWPNLDTFALRRNTGLRPRSQSNPETSGSANRVAIFDGTAFGSSSGAIVFNPVSLQAEIIPSTLQLQSPSLSPSGRWVIAGDILGSDAGLYVMNSIGEELQRFTTESDLQPTWSQDQVVFVRLPGSSCCDAELGDLYKMTLVER